MEIILSERQITSCATPGPILKTKKIRMDKKGYPIIKGSRIHSVTFKDQVQKCDIQNIHIVENWKQYNFFVKRSQKSLECCIIF